MKLYLYRFVFVFSLFFIRFGLPQSGIELTSIASTHNKITHTITCYFSQRPMCIYEPQPERDTRVAQQTVIFFVPLASLSPQCKKSLAQLALGNKSGITLSVETVTKPLRGITLTFKYDAQKKSWDHALLDADSGRHGIVLKFHDKQALARINQRSSPLRWYA